MRYFNTSGPNNPANHYTIERTALIKEGLTLVERERYFTIWAPRQTGKSTYFRQLAVELEGQGYEVAYLNFENFKNMPLVSFLKEFCVYLNQFWGLGFENENIAEIFLKIKTVPNKKYVLIIDEVEGINPEYFGDVLHSIRNAYHSRESHSLKSVILVGISNIVGVVLDNASPFNIADNLEVPYFTNEETHRLIKQHEAETGQVIEEKVIQKISEITANQPGLVNGFAKRLVDEHLHKPRLIYDDYLKVEDWYLTEAIDKNFSNILNKAREYRDFVERLLFTEDEIPFEIDRESIKVLHTNGLLKKDERGNVAFWVPFYKKRLYKAFYPYTNGEKKQIGSTIDRPDFLLPDGQLNVPKTIVHYREYVKRRGFSVFREKDEKGQYTSIKEAALMYSYETYIQALIQQLDGKTYREAGTGLGKSDLILNINGHETLWETKIYSGSNQFDKGKKQLAYYCKSLSLTAGIYLIFVPNNIKLPERVKDGVEVIEDVRIEIYLVEYDEERDF